MAELNLKQIIDRLNAEFTGDTRKLVFWYDDKADFAEDMENVELENAKIYHLQPDNQFYTKYFLERVDTTTNYLIYAPFPKPDVRDNHLEDTMLYSKRFFADRASLLSVDLGIEEKYKPVLEKHIKFFADKKRTQRFYDLEIENFNEENILTGLLSAICKARTCSFEEVVRIVLTEGSLSDNTYMQQFEQYDLLPSFWKLCEQHFGYTDVKPTLERLLVTMFVTCTARYVQTDLAAAWKSFVSYKAGNIIAVLDSLMNSVLYRDKYDELSNYVAKGLNVYQAFAGYRADDLVECDTFLAVDQVLVKWLIERLLVEDVGAKLGELTIPEVCEKRSKMHFGRKTAKTYRLLNSAYHIVKEANYKNAVGFKAIIDQYLTTDYTVDQEYRNFYYAYGQLENTDAIEPLRERVENIYRLLRLFQCVQKKLLLCVQVCDPALQPTDGTADGLHQAVGRTNIPVQVAEKGFHPTLFNLVCGRAEMDGRYLLDALPLKGAQVNTFWSASSFQIAVGDGLPAMPPDLGVLLVVPVHRVFLVALPVPGREPDALTVLVKVVYLSGFREPLAVFVHCPKR